MSKQSMENVIRGIMSQSAQVVSEAIVESPEDKEPASPDEASMAETQLEFICYAAKEIEEHIESGKKFPEWMQNKLSEVHEKMKGLHAYLGDHGDVQEATSGRKDVKCSAKKSQFGGYTALCTRDGKGIYSSQQSYKDAATAKKHAEVYADNYYSGGDRQAQAAVKNFVDKNKSKLHVKKESVEEGYKSPAEAQAIADGKKAARQGKKYSDNPHKKGSKEFTAWSKGHNMARESVKEGFAKQIVESARSRAIAESKDTFFDSYSSAISHALAQAEKKGFEVDEDDSN